MNMNTLITGGSGLLGSNIDGGLKPSSKQLNLLNYDALRSYIVENQVTKIVHSAAIVGGVHANTALICDFFLDNLTMNTNILRACREFKLNNSVFILSTCVFPADAPLPLREEYIHLGEPHHTNYGYAYAKRMLEVGSRVLKQQYDVNTVCLIPCNFYGPNDNHHLEYGHIIPSLIHKCYLAMKNNTDFVVWGSGTPKREFNYVGDIVRILQTIDDGQNNGKIYPHSMIISSGMEYSVREVATIIANKMGFKGNMVFDNSRPDGIDRKNSSAEVFNLYFPDFKWVVLEEGIDSSIEHFVKNYPNVRL